MCPISVSVHLAVKCMFLYIYMSIFIKFLSASVTAAKMIKVKHVMIILQLLIHFDDEYMHIS
jgi:hypothetical protein